MMDDLPRNCPDGVIPCDAWVEQGSCAGGQHRTMHGIRPHKRLTPEEAELARRNALEPPDAYGCPFCGEVYTKEWIGSHVRTHLVADEEERG